MEAALVRQTLAVLALALAGNEVASSRLRLSPPLGSARWILAGTPSALTPRPGELPPDAELETPSRDSTKVRRKPVETLATSASDPRTDAPGASDQTARFRVKAEVDLVLVEATVRDEHGRMVDHLTREDFHLYENGEEQQINHFSRDELPLAVALVVDRSGSMGPVLRQLRRAAYDTLSLLKPDDQVALFDFAARPERLEDLSTDRQRTANAIASIHAGGGTVITDALFEAALYLAEDAPNRRHAIILVSDNENTLRGYSNESRVIRQALEAEAVIYSIRVEEGLHPPMRAVLLPIFRDVSVPKIAHETGGEVIDANSIQSVRSAMATAISRLKQRYSLGYYSTNHSHDGAFRSIEIRIAHGPNNPNCNCTVYARRGYYAR